MTFDRAKLTPEALAAMAEGQPGGKVWGKAFDKRKTTLCEEALAELRNALAKDIMYGFYREHRLPLDVKGGPELEKCAKIPGWTVGSACWIAPSMAFLARDTRDTAEAAVALRTARNAADTVISLSFPADWAYAFFPNMVRDADLGPLWKDYLTGEKTFDEWRNYMVSRQEGRYAPIWDNWVIDPGLMFLDMYDATKEQKYLDAAKRLAKTYSNTQLPSGTWPYFFNPRTGKAVADNEWPPVLTVLFLDRLAAQYGIRDYEQTADRAFQWVWEKEVVPFDLRAHYWDVPPKPRGSQGALAASEIAMCLFNCAERNPEYLAKGEEILRWVEKTFVSWDQGGAVSEQTGFMAKVRFAGGGVAQAYVKAFEVTGDPIYLAKGLTIFHTVLENKGKEPFDWYGCRAAINALDVYPFLKKHNLPGGE